MPLNKPCDSCKESEKDELNGDSLLWCWCPLFAKWNRKRLKDAQGDKDEE